MKLLRERPRSMTLKMISDDTGLPEGWLISIQSHPELRPNIDRVEWLLRYLLKDTKLTLRDLIRLINVS